MSLFTELKRRNVIRMGGLYLVGSWLFIQIAETLLPLFHTPEWVLQAMVVLLALGFIPALVFSWLFELTPEGIKRDADVDRENSIAPRTAKRMNQLTLAGVVLLLIVIAADRYWPKEGAESTSVTTEQVATEIVAPQSSADPTSEAPATTATPENSIAVLPFVNMSSDAEQEYFSEGISEEILNVLARVPDLQVAARTSSFSFKGGNKEVSEIAEALRVRMVLEGSVRKQGERVRITAQLIDAQSGFHLWSDTYDRDLKDIFAVQDEIAQSIAEQLKLQVAGDAGMASDRGETNPEAYDLYLRGLALWQLRGEDNLWKAVELLERALELDPDFVQAEAGLALTYIVIDDYSNRITTEEAERKARSYAERALAGDPNLPEIYAVLGSLAAEEQRWKVADLLYRRAIELRPSYATAYQWMGTDRMGSGELEGALEASERAVALDPRSGVVANNLGWVLIALGRNAEADNVCERALEFTPGFETCSNNLIFTDLLRGDFAAARSHLAARAGETGAKSAAQLPRMIEALQGQGDRRAMAESLAASAPKSWLDSNSGNLFPDFTIPALLVLLGENELAIDYLQRAANNNEIVGVDWAVMMPAVDAIRCDPRFVAIVKELQSTDPHYARVCGAKP